VTFDEASKVAGDYVRGIHSVRGYYVDRSMGDFGEAIKNLNLAENPVSFFAPGSTPNEECPTSPTPTAAQPQSSSLTRSLPPPMRGRDGLCRLFMNLLRFCAAFIEMPCRIVRRRCPFVYRLQRLIPNGIIEECAM
jgi:hypothetical protein